ncbi:5-dehydro-2-deoxygluconokinase [Actinophytocola sp.]|uniref:5-dehydro-2-deoxygluconokinase n=1 Tax=Actinophytocola sp. TaxID=1872138 RepID=UPI002D80A93E|nr:5-dehydro-2-deoxygluconokinase [Actinophytocola sp.]HET9142356.1 5-dehydro-2-deoxygluconokinase [Actinophytocola sp.]
MSLDLLTVGRVGVDLYPEQTGVPLERVRTFAKSLGGTATNVAVAAARLGRRAAVLTKVGADPFGGYVRDALRGFGVSAEFVGTAPDLRTPVVFCALDPPEDPPLLFYRLPVAPDLTLAPADVPWPVVAEVPVLWVTGTGVSTEPARATQREILVARGRRTHTVLDLDYRPMFWSGVDTARREIGWMLDHVTVAVGNRAEVEVAVGTADPAAAAEAMLARGVSLAVVKQGADGVLVATPEGSWTIPPAPVEVVCGLGAGDAFGGALVHGLLSGWEPARIARYAAAAGAIVAGRLACADAMPGPEEIEELLV